MKPILLLHPPFEGKNYLKSRAPFPLGLLYIAAYLKKKGIKSEVIDMSYPPIKSKTFRPPELKTGQTNYFRFGWDDTQIILFLGLHKKEYQKIIGVSSLMSSNWTGAYRLINLIKQIIPDSTIVIGGPHAITNFHHVMKHTKIDYVCLGEGEKYLYKLIKGKYNEKKSDGCLINDLDSLPFIDRDLLNDDREIKELYITFSRGCPHRCSFCASHLIQGRIWRHKSVDRCIDELVHYKEKWGVKKFIIEDDNPCPGKEGAKFLRSLCQNIIDKKLKIRLKVSHGLPVYFTKDLHNCELLWSAGFREFVLPLESSDKEVLKDMRKTNTLNDWREALYNCSNFEKNIPTEIILGYPFVETIRTMLKTMLHVYNHGSIIWASHFRLYKGIPLFERCLEHGYITKDYDPINTQSFYIETERFNLNDLRELMQISKGLNAITENPEAYKSLIKTTRIGSIVLKGKFKFRRSQNIAASILLASTGKFCGRPVVNYLDNERLILKGDKPSKVWAILTLLTSETGGAKKVTPAIHEFF